MYSPTQSQLGRDQEGGRAAARAAHRVLTLASHISTSQENIDRMLSSVNLTRHAESPNTRALNASLQARNHYPFPTNPTPSHSPPLHTPLPAPPPSDPHKHPSTV